MVLGPIVGSLLGRQLAEGHVEFLKGYRPHEYHLVVVLEGLDKVGEFGGDDLMGVFL